MSATGVEPITEVFASKPLTGLAQSFTGKLSRARDYVFYPSIVLLVLVSRIWSRSDPYFVDGPAHVRAIATNRIFIQPPGYYLFGMLGSLVSRASHLSPAGALSLINIVFSVLGSLVFARLAMRIFPSGLATALSFCYATSTCVWFAADIHSTYASMTFFAPLLLYAIWTEADWTVVGVIWALMAGLRPSDGVFVFPFLAYQLIGLSFKRNALKFILGSLPIVALWYVPTVRHFGGIFSPLMAAHSQAEHISNGLLSHASAARKIGNLIHIFAGGVDGWSLLLPLIFVGLLTRIRATVALAVWMLPGLIFFALYFFSDALYLSYLIAPGFLLAGYGLQRIGRTPAIALTVLTIGFSTSQMLFSRPLHNTGRSAAVMNSYVLQYSRWSLRHQYWERLGKSLN